MLGTLEITRTSRATRATTPSTPEPETMPKADTTTPTLTQPVYHACLLCFYRFCRCQVAVYRSIILVDLQKRRKGEKKSDDADHSGLEVNDLASEVQEKVDEEEKEEHVSDIESEMSDDEDVCHIPAMTTCRYVRLFHSQSYWNQVEEARGGVAQAQVD